MDGVMVPPWVLAIFTVVAAVGASGGFWAYLQYKDQTRKATTQLLLGLAHDRIIFLGSKYIENESITTDEYEDLIKYLWEPYSHFGGNGLAERVMLEVKKLPIKGIISPIIRTIEEKHEHQYPVERAGDIPRSRQAPAPHQRDV